MSCPGFSTTLGWWRNAARGETGPGHGREFLGQGTRARPFARQRRRRYPSRVLVLLDNRDSFTFNLVQALEILGARVEVLPGQSTTLGDILGLRPSHILIGPGPGGPAAARVGLELVRADSLDLPILGVCLGHQVLALALGARVQPAREPVHGRPARVEHDGMGVFSGLPNPVVMGRYHSLAVVEPSLPPELVVSARAEDGTVQGLRHRTRPLEGVQFHPESILSEHGSLLLGNFLKR